MSDRVICPKCGHSSSKHRATCKNCRVNLAQAVSETVIMEQPSTPNLTKDQATTLEVVEKNFAEDSGGAKVKGSLFKESDYTPFMLGVFIVGGLLVIPLIWGLRVGLEYFAALTWSIASCVVFLIAFRRNGTISWVRAIPVIAAILIAARFYAQSTGKPAFVAGGALGFLAIMICGYIGIGLGRLTGLSVDNKAEVVSVTTKKCPSCAEEIKLEAKVCRYCGHKFDEADIIKIEKSLQSQASLKEKQTSLKKMTRIFRNSQIGGIFFITFGIAFILLFIMSFSQNPNNIGIWPTLILVSLFSSLVLGGIFLIKKANKLKIDLIRLNEEIEELVHNIR